MHTYSRVVQWMSPIEASRPSVQPALDASVDEAIVKIFCTILENSANVQHQLDTKRPGSLMNSILSHFQAGASVAQNPVFTSTIQHSLFSVFIHGDTTFRSAIRELSRNLFEHKISVHCIETLQHLHFDEHSDLISSLTSLRGAIEPFWLFKPTIVSGDLISQATGCIDDVIKRTPLKNMVTLKPVALSPDAAFELAVIIQTLHSKIHSYLSSNGSASLNTFVESCPRPVLVRNIQRRWRENRDGLRSYIDCAKRMNPNLLPQTYRTLGIVLEEATSFLLMECLLSLSGQEITLAHLNSVMFDELEIKEYFGLNDVFKQFAQDLDAAFSNHVIAMSTYNHTNFLLDQLKPSMVFLGRRVHNEGLVVYQLLGGIEHLMPDEARPNLKLITDVFKALPSIRIQAFARAFEAAVVEEMRNDIISISEERPEDFIAALRVVIVEYLALLRVISAPRHCVQRVMQLAITGSDSEASSKITVAVQEICRTFDPSTPLLHESREAATQLGLLYRDAYLWENIFSLDLGLRKAVEEGLLFYLINCLKHYT